jgi:hypothetical protein
MTSSLLSTPTSVAGLLFGDDPAGALAERLDATGALDAARERVAGLGADVWAGARSQLAGIAADFCALDVASVVVSAWRKHRALVDAAETTLATGATVVVPLGSRRISLVEHPSIDVTMGRATVAVVRFELALDVDVEGVAGVVRAGALVALQGGRCDVSARFAAAGVTLGERKASYDPGLAVPLGSGLVLAVPTQRGPHRRRVAQASPSAAVQPADDTSPRAGAE